MSQINEDVAKELRELRENKEVMAKELKQLHNKADWLNRCIKIKFNVKRRECEYIASFKRNGGTDMLQHRQRTNPSQSRSSMNSSGVSGNC